MPLDTRIALGAQPLQLESPLAQYGQAVGIQNAMQQNQLGQMQMSAAQRAAEEEMGIRNYLTDPKTDLSTAEGQQGLMRFGAKGQMMLKNVAEQKKLSLEGQKLSTEIFGLTQKHFLEANSPIAAAANGEKGVENFIRATYAHPVLGALAKEIKPLDQAIAENVAMFKKDPDQWTTAHLNLDPKSAVDAVAAARERANEAARIASLPPLPTAVGAVGMPNATGAGLVTPGAAAVVPAAAVAPVTAVTIAPDLRVSSVLIAEAAKNPNSPAARLLPKMKADPSKWELSLAPNSFYDIGPSGQIVTVRMPESQLTSGANALAPAAAVNVNALAAPTGNDATLQAIAAARKPIEDRLAALNRQPYSKGKENEEKNLQAQLKELNTPINLREAGTAITPYGTVTAAPAPTELARLQKEKLAAVAAGDKTAAAQIDSKIAVMTQLQDHRSEVEKMLAITADPNASKEAKDAANGRIANLTHVAKEATPAHIQEYEYAKKNNGYAGTLAEFLHPVQEPALIQEYNFAVKNGFKGSIYAFKSAPEHAPALVQEFEYAKKNGYTGSIADFKALTAPRVAVEDVNRPGNVVLVSPSASEGRTPAKDITGLAPKEIQAREAKYPQAMQAVKTLESKTESLAKDIETLANHPGLTGISGLVYGRTPAVTKDARAAQALYDSIVARGGFSELQSMRAASPTGGALGNVSNQEGQYLRDAWAAINRTQDTADLKANLLKAAGQARDSKDRIKEAFDATYDYRANKDAAAAPQGTGGFKYLGKE